MILVHHKEMIRAITANASDDPLDEWILPGAPMGGTLCTGFETPEQFESFSVPSNDGIRFDDNQSILPGTPKFGKQSPENPVDRSDFWPFVCAFQHRQLLPERKVFNG